MTKEELGLPWDQDIMMQVADGWAINDNTDIDPLDFALKACNNHHALVEALEKIADCDAGDDAWWFVDVAEKALEAVK
jgi:hypothetical protein